jgi:DNA-binding NtrC family response regulator
MGKARVLLVDDEEDFTRTLAARMSLRELQVDVAGDGITALKMAQESIYDAVILDLAMPGIDGIETLKRLHVQNPDLQVMLLTGHATLEKGIEAVKLGAMEFLEKPVNLELLLEKIAAARDKGSRLREQRQAAAIDDILRSRGW